MPGEPAQPDTTSALNAIKERSRRFMFLFRLFCLRDAEQAPFAVLLAQVEPAVALAALRLVAHAHFLAGQALGLEAAQHGDLAVRPRLGVLPLHALVVGRVAERR